MNQAGVHAASQPRRALRWKSVIGATAMIAEGFRSVQIYLYHQGNVTTDTLQKTL